MNNNSLGAGQLTFIGSGKTKNIIDIDLFDHQNYNTIVYTGGATPVLKNIEVNIVQSGLSQLKSAGQVPNVQQNQLSVQNVGQMAVQSGLAELKKDTNQVPIDESVTTPLLDFVRITPAVKDPIRGRGGLAWRKTDGIPQMALSGSSMVAFSVFVQPGTLRRLDPNTIDGVVFPKAKFFGGQRQTLKLVAKKDLFRYNPGESLEKTKDFNPHYWKEFLKGSGTPAGPEATDKDLPTKGEEETIKIYNLKPGGGKEPNKRNSLRMTPEGVVVDVEDQDYGGGVVVGEETTIDNPDFDII